MSVPCHGYCSLLHTYVYLCTLSKQIPLKQNEESVVAIGAGQRVPLVYENIRIA